MKFHELKTDTEQFVMTFCRSKNFEIRNDDRGYKIGDYLVLCETEHSAAEMKKGMPLRYTGRKLTRVVNYIQRGYGLPDGVIVMALDRV